MVYEDFDLYAEWDPTIKIVPIDVTITLTQLARNAEGYVADDKGVNHFNGNFQHLVDVENTAKDGVNGKYACWALSTELLHSESEHDASGTSECLLLWCGYDPLRWQLRNWVNGGLESWCDISGAYAYGTPYYVKITRVGVNVEVRIYSDANRTIEVGNGNLNQLAVHPYQYIHGVLGAEYAGAAWTSAVVENLDLQEVVPLKPSSGSIASLMEGMRLLATKREPLIKPFSSRLPKFIPKFGVRG